MPVGCLPPPWDARGARAAQDSPSYRPHCERWCRAGGARGGVPRSRTAWPAGARDGSGGHPTGARSGRGGLDPAGLRAPPGRRCQHCGILWFIFLTKKNESLTVEEMFVRVTPEKRTFLPQRRFSFVLLIICDNLIFIFFFNIKFNQPIKQTYFFILTFRKQLYIFLHPVQCL